MLATLPSRSLRENLTMTEGVCSVLSCPHDGSSLDGWYSSLSHIQCEAGWLCSPALRQNNQFGHAQLRRKASAKARPALTRPRNAGARVAWRTLQTLAQRAIAARAHRSKQKGARVRRPRGAAPYFPHSPGNVGNRKASL